MRETERQRVRERVRAGDEKGDIDANVEFSLGSRGIITVLLAHTNWVCGERDVSQSRLVRGKYCLNPGLSEANSVSIQACQRQRVSQSRLVRGKPVFNPGLSEPNSVSIQAFQRQNSVSVP